MLAQEGDPAHPVAVAEHLAQALPEARLEVLPPGGIMWRHRRTVRDLVGAFLSEGSGGVRHNRRPRARTVVPPNASQEQMMRVEMSIAARDRSDEVFVIERPGVSSSSSSPTRP